MDHIGHVCPLLAGLDERRVIVRENCPSALGSAHGGGAVRAGMVVCPVFELADEQRLAGVTRRMLELRTVLTKPRYRGSAVASSLAHRIEQFRTDLVAIAGAQI